MSNRARLYDLENGYIYTAECFKDGRRYVKIGFSTDPKSRVKSMGPGNTITIPGASRPRLTGCFSGSYLVEQKLHDNIGHLRICGEWYPANDPTVQLVISELGRRDSMGNSEPADDNELDETVAAYIEPPPPDIHWCAVDMGRRGGSKKNPNKGFGSLTIEQRSAIAKKAARARWKDKSEEKS